MEDVAKAVDDVEKDLLLEIVANLKRNKLDRKKAELLAREFLSLLPPKDFSELIQILKKLSPDFAEARDVYIKYFAIQEKINDQSKVALMGQHISTGNIEKAIEVAKGGQANG